MKIGQILEGNASSIRQLDAIVLNLQQVPQGTIINQIKRSG